MNSVRHFNKDNFKFDNEHQQEIIAQMMETRTLSEDSARSAKKDGGNEYGITNNEYIKNVILFSLLFTCFSFCFWLSDFQAEYLGTDMYILFYAQGAVCIVSGYINLLLYERLGMKQLIIYCQIITIIGATFIIMVQEKIFKYNDTA